MWLKRRTPQNIVIGGAAGAFPAVIGWAAVTGSVDVVPLILFAIVFFWTPPHFWSLALFANDDYRRAGVPMLPVVAGARETRKQILLYTLLLVPLSLLPWAIGFSGLIYGASALVLGLGFLGATWRVYTDRQDACRRQPDRRRAGQDRRSAIPFSTCSPCSRRSRSIGWPDDPRLHGRSPAPDPAPGRRNAPPPARPQYCGDRGARRAVRAVLRHYAGEAVRVVNTG